jgi:holliday junction DNA helicase RuvA
MISGLRGRIASKLPGVIHLDVHGVTFKVLTSQNSVEAAGAVGEEISLLTHLYVREDQLTLFGFMAQDELQLFELLQSVSGIGPKVALGILSAAQPDEIYDGIANEDVSFLSRMPGIGKKTAGRIIFDLRGKLPEPTGAMAGVVSGRPTPHDLEALEALQTLGYSAAEARAALGRVESRDGQTAEERVYAALQTLAAGN